MICVATLLHDDVHDPAERAAMLGFNAGTLDLNFLNEVKRYVGMGEAANLVRSILAFHQIGVLRI